jgi:hypothetical protein
MENASLSILFPRATDQFVDVRPREGTFATQSEYIRSLKQGIINKFGERRR